MQLKSGYFLVFFSLFNSRSTPEAGGNSSIKSRRGRGTEEEGTEEDVGVVINVYLRRKVIILV